MRVCDANLLREWCAVRRPRYGSGDTAAATRSSAQHVHVLVCVCACERVSCVLCVIRNVAGHEVERGAEFAQHRVETMAAWFGGIVWRWFIVRLCAGCATTLSQPTGGKCRLTEGCSFRKKVD